jgi:hypothetical protein
MLTSEQEVIRNSNPRLFANQKAGWMIGQFGVFFAAGFYRGRLLPDYSQPIIAVKRTKQEAEQVATESRRIHGKLVCIEQL